MGLMEQVKELSGQEVGRCYYCLRCTAGCPSAYAMDYSPAQVLRLVQLGQKEVLLRSSAIWLCIGCETCGTRCPNGVHAGAVMDALRQMAVREGVEVGEKRVKRLHEAFLRSIWLWGRLHELTMLAEYKLRSGDLFSDLDMGLRMMVRGKIVPWPQRIGGVKQVRALFRRRGER